MAFLSTIETSHNIFDKIYCFDYKLVNYISYSNSTSYYFVNYKHLVLCYIVDHCIDFDYLVHYKFIIVFVLMPFVLLFILHVLV